MKKILVLIIIGLLCLSTFSIIAPQFKVSAFSPPKLLVMFSWAEYIIDQAWTFPDGTTFTFRGWLQSKGYLVSTISEAFPTGEITLSGLQEFQALLVFGDFFADPANIAYTDTVLTYLNLGGGLILLGQASLPSITFDEELGFRWSGSAHGPVDPWSFYVDASITDYSHPVMQGITELPKAGGVFINWDTLIDETPLPTGTAVLARTTGSGGPYDPIDRIALIAFQYGNGRVVVGPWDGLARPYGPTAVDPWDVVAEPVVENKLLINAIRWISTHIRAWKDDVSFGLENDHLMLYGDSAKYVGGAYPHYMSWFKYLIFKDTGTKWTSPWGDIFLLYNPNMYYAEVGSIQIEAFTEINEAKIVYRADIPYDPYVTPSGPVRIELTITIRDGPYIYWTVKITNTDLIQKTIPIGLSLYTFIAGDAVNDYYYVPGHGQGQFIGTQMDIKYYPTESWVTVWDQSKQEGVGIINTKGFTVPRVIISDWYGLTAVPEMVHFVGEITLEAAQTSQIFDQYLYFFEGTGWEKTKIFHDSLINQPPVADFRYRGARTSFIPSTIYVGSEVKFDAEPSYDLDGPDQNPVSYTWDFGDQSDLLTTTEEVADHTYVASGPYTVTLTVTDDKGVKDVISKDIFINPLGWEIYFEIDYMTGHKPTDSVLGYIHSYFRDNGIYVYFFIDDEISVDPSVTRAEFWALEKQYNDVMLFDDRAEGSEITALTKLAKKEKWVLYGTETDFSWMPDAHGVIFNVPYITDRAANYIFIADEFNDQSALPVTAEQIETVALMHEIGHSIGITLWDWPRWRDQDRDGTPEDYDNEAKSVMARLTLSNCNSEPVGYSHRYWLLKDIEHYEI